jgi:hypothetical protein
MVSSTGSVFRAFTSNTIMKTFAIALFIGGLFLVSGCRTSCTSCGRASDLVILKAVYGVGATRSVDVTDEIRSLAKSGSIHLHPQWGLGVDPAYGATKRVTVSYRYKGRFEVATFDQFEEFVIPSDQ